MKIAKAVQPKQTSGCDQYRALVQKYNWNVQTMMAVMEAESTCNANAVGDNYAINGLHAVSCGLMQVRTLQGRPTCKQLKDPATNIKAAYEIYKSQGYNAWSMFSNGEYLKHLK